MPLANYYEILEVPFDASLEEIRQNFRETARRCHPDSGNKSPFDFSLLTEAYKTLRDPIQREAYDKALQAEYPYFVSAPRSPVLANGASTAQVTQHTSGGPWLVLESGLKITGHLSGRGDLVIKGEVHGTVSMRGQHLVIAETGKVGVFTEATEIEVWGCVVGELRASRRVILRRGARVTGDIRTPALVVEDGAYCSGAIAVEAG